MSEDLSNRVGSLETRLNAIEKDLAVTTSEFLSLKSDLSEIKGSLTWVTRLILGALILGIVGFITAGGLNLNGV